MTTQTGQAAAPSHKDAVIEQHERLQEDPNISHAQKTESAKLVVCPLSKATV